MICQSIDVKKSIDAFYQDFQFIKKLHGNKNSLTKPARNKSKRAYMIADTQQAFELSRRQVDVMSYMKHITSRKNIALEMNISIKTLEDHLLVMRKKMHCETVQAMFDLVQSGKVIEA